MNMKTSVGGGLMVLAVVLAPQIVRAQAFTNLDFEHPILPLVPVFNFVPASSAIPGWSAYFNTSTASNVPASVGYDTVSAGGAAIILEDANDVLGPLPIQGSYSVYLEGPSYIPPNNSNPTAASIGQTGTIPATAQSLIFDLGEYYGGLQLSFNGQDLTFEAISNTLNYTIYGANIASYAGQTGQLLFTAPIDTSALLDNIQFSSIPIPEPGVLVLLGLGGLAFLWHRRKSANA